MDKCKIQYNKNSTHHDDRWARKTSNIHTSPSENHRFRRPRFIIPFFRPILPIPRPPYRLIGSDRWWPSCPHLRIVCTYNLSVGNNTGSGEDSAHCSQSLCHSRSALTYLWVDGGFKRGGLQGKFKGLFAIGISIRFYVGHWIYTQ